MTPSSASLFQATTSTNGSGLLDHDDEVVCSPNTGIKRLVDAAEAKKTYLDKSLAKMRMLFGGQQGHQQLHSEQPPPGHNNDHESDGFHEVRLQREEETETETETESSPSGYETDTSDTDIDAAVNLYRDETSLPTPMQERRDSQLSSSGKSASPRQKSPTRATANVVLAATLVLLMSFILQFLIIDNVQSSTMINAIILNLGVSVAVFVLLLVISKQPKDKSRGRTDQTFIVPLAPWSQALAIFLNLSLLARVLHSAGLELVLWIFTGKNPKTTFLKGN
jgi:hypothetical protein